MTFFTSTIYEIHHNRPLGGTEVLVDIRALFGENVEHVPQRRLQILTKGWILPEAEIHSCREILIR